MTRAYHHGALRQAILETALAAIAADGPAALSLRELARRADVSHAAPAHHFKDKAGLLTAIAVDGYLRLGEALGSAGPALLDIGASYVRFALEHPAHFEVMFSPELYHQDDADLVAARARTNAILSSAVTSGSRKDADRSTGLAAWSLAHGFATLWASGSMARTAPAGSDPIALFRTVAVRAFTPGR